MHDIRRADIIDGAHLNLHLNCRFIDPVFSFCQTKPQELQGVRHNVLCGSRYTELHGCRIIAKLQNWSPLQSCHFCLLLMPQAPDKFPADLQSRDWQQAASGFQHPSYKASKTWLLPAPPTLPPSPALPYPTPPSPASPLRQPLSAVPPLLLLALLPALFTQIQTPTTAHTNPPWTHPLQASPALLQNLRHHPQVAPSPP